MLPQQALVDQYLGTQPVKWAYLFGSKARGEASTGSDIDMPVELEKRVTLFDFARMQMRLEELLHAPVDLVSANGLSSHIKPYIDLDKILIYEKANERQGLYRTYTW